MGRIKEYFQLRKVGHNRRESIKRTTGYAFAALYQSFSHYDGVPYEVQIEEMLCYLEACDLPDFQSLTDIINNEFQLSSKRYTSNEEAYLTVIHQTYCNNKALLSSKQVGRYETFLKRLPSKFNELLSTIEKGELTDYQKKKRETFNQKIKD